MENKYL